MSPYIRTVTTASGAIAVRVIMSEHAGKKSMTHIGSAHDEHELALLKAEAQRVIDGDQLSLDLGLSASARLASTGVEDQPSTGKRAKI